MRLQQVHSDAAPLRSFRPSTTSATSPTNSFTVLQTKSASANLKAWEAAGACVNDAEDEDREEVPGSSKTSRSYSGSLPSLWKRKSVEPSPPSEKCARACRAQERGNVRVCEIVRASITGKERCPEGHAGRHVHSPSTYRSERRMHHACGIDLDHEQRHPHSRNIVS